MIILISLLPLSGRLSGMLIRLKETNSHESQTEAMAGRQAARGGWAA